MTRKAKPESLYDERASTPGGAQSLAAADLAIQVSRLLFVAIRRARVTQQELANRLGLTEGRVSQVVNGDGNIHMATLGRFMRALGYNLELRATPAAPGLTPIEPQQPRRTRDARRRAKDDEIIAAYEQSMTNESRQTQYAPTGVSSYSISYTQPVSSSNFVIAGPPHA